jgi:hypothetical protein
VPGRPGGPVRAKRGVASFTIPMLAASFNTQMLLTSNIQAFV